MINTCFFSHMQFLIAKRVDLDAGDMFRVTAMHLAAIENHPDIIEALLKARANVNPVDEEGDLPIHWAATKGHSEVRSSSQHVFSFCLAWLGGGAAQHPGTLHTGSTTTAGWLAAGMCSFPAQIATTGPGHACTPWLKSILQPGCT